MPETPETDDPESRVLKSPNPFFSHETLVLNADHTPLEYPLKRLNGEETVKGMFLDRYNVVKWSDTYAHSINFEIRLPKVVALKQYVHSEALYGTPSCNFQNLFLRDVGTCQYTGEALRKSSPNPALQATIDHVNPRARGGLITWENAVLASMEINGFKGNRTPAEAGLRLLHKPWAPTGADLLYLYLSRDRLESIDPEWLDFLQLKPSARVSRILETLARAA